MLLTSGIIALGQKAAKERAKRKEKQQAQGVLQVGDSDVAKRAFVSQTSKMIEQGDSKSPIAQEDIKFEDPTDVKAASPSSAAGDADLKDIGLTSQMDMSSPVQSETGLLSPTSASTATPTASKRFGDRSSYEGPPPYTSTASSTNTPISPSIYSQMTESSTVPSDARSISSRSTNSQGTHAIRIKTRGPDLRSGFAYHPALYDLRVHPEQWEDFTSQITNATKLSTGDYAKVWGAATGVAFTGAIVTSVFVGQSMNRAARERKIQEGLKDLSDGGLGDKLRMWNEDYFSKQGLFVHLELSESTVKNDGRTKAFRKPAAFYSKGEERDRKKDERKFVIVVTKLDEDGQPMEAIQELSTETGPVEIGSSGGPTMTTAELPAEVPVPVELPADTNAPVKLPADTNAPVELPADMSTPVELPADTTLGKEKDSQIPDGVVEMSGDNARLLEKMNLHEDTTYRIEIPGSKETT